MLCQVCKLGSEIKQLDRGARSSNEVVELECLQQVWLWKRGFHSQLVTILVVVSNVDSSTRLSWMLRLCFWHYGDVVPILRRGGETHTNTNNLYKNPLTTYKWGNERTGRKSKFKSAFCVLKSGLYKPLSCHPGHPLLIMQETRIPIPSQTVIHLAQRSSPIGSLVHVLDETHYRIQQVLQLCATPKSLVHHTTLVSSI